ncbi:glutaredoxin 3 [Sinimarinibacterium sp. NLF-5-8]|uniref:glutaredoxin 3 n=1 Tax=Sinimarinibacterium sp. NLF-5-8 TaxID=2698684 RepID=UPI00137BA08E|nr:glutaredoxin 3 [Sinimarinibacterium sp. NLF-5-8]QHS11046.1 glutaredoxin 3 [Sinimarinibacterium sp. NLF-5-8]
MTRIRMYATGSCPYCMMAKRLLTEKGVAFEEIRVDYNAELRAEMMRLSGRRTVPQIFIDDFHVGGCDDLYALDQQGKLDPLLRG